MGTLPDFHGFELTRNRCLLKLKHFKEKRTFINIFEFLQPDEMVMKMKLVCKKFYILSWNDELMTKLCFHSFGIELFEEIKYRIAKRLHKVKNGIEDKVRYFIETTTEEENSDSFNSDDCDRPHIRQDGNSSADDENKLKDFFRRNAREEFYSDKKVKNLEKDRKEDFKVIEKCRF